MNTAKKLLSLACTLALTGNVAAAQHANATGTAGVLSIPAEGPGDSLYRLGRQAVTDNDYRRAAGLFKQVVDKYPKAEPAGDALYWRAWSLYHLGVDRRSKSDLDDAIDALDLQRKSYAKSAAGTDASSLRTQIRSAQANLGDARAAGDIATEAKGLSQQRPCSGSKADEETRLAALEGLMSMNSEDAIPILKDVLKQRDACREESRKRAVWLISQKRGTDVVATLLDVARTDPSTDVRTQAVFWLSQAGGEQAIPALDSILFSVGDEDLRKNAIFALSQHPRDERARRALQRAAEDERMPEEIRSDAIFWLGNAGLADLDYFKALFGKTRDSQLREKIIFSVSQSSVPQASAWLLDLARDKKADTEARKSAIFQLSQRKTIDLDGLTSIYDQAKGDDEIQEQVLFVYSQRRESAAVDKLMNIAKADPNIEMRKKALFWLGQKNDPRVKQFIRDLLK